MTWKGSDPDRIRTVPLINVSGSGRPKTLQIRIRNTAPWNGFSVPPVPFKDRVGLSISSINIGLWQIILFFTKQMNWRKQRVFEKENSINCSLLIDWLYELFNLLFPAPLEHWDFGCKEQERCATVQSGSIGSGTGPVLIFSCDIFSANNHWMVNAGLVATSLFRVIFILPRKPLVFLWNILLCDTSDFKIPFST